MVRANNFKKLLAHTIFVIIYYIVLGKPLFDFPFIWSIVKVASTKLKFSFKKPEKKNLFT